MVREFRFEDDVQLKIMGEEFSLDSSDPSLIETLKKFEEEGQEFAEEMKTNKTKTEVEKIVEMAKYCVTVIDSILGENASKRIFKDTPVTYYKALGIISYIGDELNAGTDKVLAEYSPNRAQRRSK